ncbi:MAG: hypothetical protein ACLVH9_05210 [Fusobacterium sp.]|uniref:hypothetical protein n=1 Tax=Fusobacterium sp. TaxID=68766 RepID=UPI0039994ADE
MNDIFAIIFKNVKFTIGRLPFVQKENIKSQYKGNDFEILWKKLEDNNCIERTVIGNKYSYLNPEFYKDLKKEFNML